MNKQNQIIDDWNNSSDDYFRRWDYVALFNALEEDPYKGFPHTMAAIIKEYYPDLKGKNVCVPSCGDNVAVFGFCALGANVTATDISYKQIENAQKIAKERNLDIKYYVSDSMKLNSFEIKRMEEFHSLIEDFPNHNYLFDKEDINHEKYDWHKNPYAALPQCLGLLCQKVENKLI